MSLCRRALRGKIPVSLSTPPHTTTESTDHSRADRYDSGPLGSSCTDGKFLRQKLPFGAAQRSLYHHQRPASLSNLLGTYLESRHVLTDSRLVCIGSRVFKILPRWYAGHSLTTPHPLPRSFHLSAAQHTHCRFSCNASQYHPQPCPLCMREDCFSMLCSDAACVVFTP